MNYAEIAELNRQTSELTRRITLKWDVISVAMVIVCLVMIALAIRLIWEGHQERKARKMAAWGQYQPTVTDTVQYINGVEFHRMGPVERR